MNNRKRFQAAMLIPVLLAVLACPAWAGPSVRKGSHYPGQDCSGCHKVRGKPAGKASTNSTPAKVTPGTGAAGSKTGATPAKKATQPR